VNANGEAYITGSTISTTSANFPVTPGAFQTSFLGAAGYIHGFVTKLNAAGNDLAYSTYLGGTGQVNAADAPGGIKVDAAGNAYIGGYTGSTDFPTTPGVVQQDYIGGLRHIFVTKLNPTGTATRVLHVCGRP
jgi:Beta-propeller repeat